jgi:hypothetical protein
MIKATTHNSRLPQWALIWLIKCIAFINICAWMTVKYSEIRHRAQPPNVSGKCNIL